MTEKIMGCVNCGADDHDTKDCTRLPAVAWRCEWVSDSGGGMHAGLSKTSLVGLRRSEGDEVLIVTDEPLCRLTDAQALIAELRAEVDRLWSDRHRDAALIHELRQAAPAERGVVLPDELTAGMRQSMQYIEGLTDNYSQDLLWRALKVARLNPAPATAEQAVGEVVWPAGPGRHGAFKTFSNRNLEPGTKLYVAPATADSDVREVSE